MLEKLFYYILTFTFLLIPLTIFFFRNRIKRSDSIAMGSYGVLFFLLLYAIDNSFVPSSYLKLYQTGYTLFEYSFFTYFLFTNITIKSLRKIIVSLSFLFLLFLIYNFFWENLLKIDSIPVGIETILILIYISFFLYQNFHATTDVFIYNNSCFWLAIGILIYLGSTFFFNILVNHIEEEQIEKYWFLTYISDIIKNLLFCVSIIIYANTTQKEKLHNHKHIPYLDLDMN